MTNRKVRCRFCKREIFLNDFRSHLRVIHPSLVKEKMPIETVESVDESILLLTFSMMEMLREDSPGPSNEEEPFSGKGGEFGGAGASEDFSEKCDMKCKSCCSPESDSSPEEESETDSSSDSESKDNE